MPQPTRPETIAAELLHNQFLNKGTPWVEITFNQWLGIINLEVELQGTSPAVAEQLLVKELQIWVKKLNTESLMIKTLESTNLPTFQIESLTTRRDDSTRLIYKSNGFTIEEISHD